MYYATALTKIQNKYGDETYAIVSRHGERGHQRLDMAADTELKLRHELICKFSADYVAENLGVNFRLSEKLPGSSENVHFYQVYRANENGELETYADIMVYPGLEYPDYEWKTRDRGLNTHSFPWWLWER